MPLGHRSTTVVAAGKGETTTTTLNFGQNQNKVTDNGHNDDAKHKRKGGKIPRPVVVAVLFLIGSLVVVLDGQSGEEGWVTRYRRRQEETNVRPKVCKKADLDLLSEFLSAASSGDETLESDKSPTRECANGEWLDRYYSERKKRLSSSLDRVSDRFFLGLDAGCHKGFNAIHMLRLATQNPEYNKNDWALALQRFAPDYRIPEKGCLTHHDLQKSFRDSGEVERHDARDGLLQVHCIEPDKSSVRMMKHAAEDFGWSASSHGPLRTTHALVTDKRGATLLPQTEGERCEEEEEEEDPQPSPPLRKSKDTTCERVHTYSLDFYMRHVVRTKYHDPSTGEEFVKWVDILSLGTSIHDAHTVLVGGQDFVLAHTRYLEFHHENADLKPSHDLYDLIHWLDTEWEFACYWMVDASTLIRITHCWIDEYYDSYPNNAVLPWSKIACVNLHLAQQQVAEQQRQTQEQEQEENEKDPPLVLAKLMEDNFQNVLKELRRR